MKRIQCRMGFSAFILLIGIANSAVGADKDVSEIQIGIPKSIFQGIPSAFIEPLSQPFRKLMKDQTGISGNVQHLGDAMTVANLMDQGKIHLAVFQGHEFAWAQSKFKDLTPIVVAVPNNPKTQVYLLVKWDCPAKNLGDLKTEKIVMPPGTKDYTRLFLEQQKAKYLPKADFSATLAATSVEDAIHDVCDGKAQVTCVDTIGWEYFQAANPGRAKNLKILAQSSEFPPACVAVRKGDLPQETVEKFRRCLLNATDLAQGRQMMTLWKLKKFDHVPANYDQQLSDCAKQYPFSQSLPKQPEK